MPRFPRYVSDEFLRLPVPGGLLAGVGGTAAIRQAVAGAIGAFWVVESVESTPAYSGNRNRRQQRSETTAVHIQKPTIIEAAGNGRDPNSKPPDVTDQVIAGTGEPTKTLRKHRLRWLVLAHVAIGLSTGMLVAWIRSPSKPQLVATVFVGVVFCQTSLVGIWGGLGMSSRWNRLLGVMLGMGYLGLLMDLCLVGYLTSDSHFIVSLATLPVAGVLLIVRCFGVRICLTTVTKVAAPRNQFSIRQLLILTFAVACLMSLGKWLEPHLLPVTNPFYLP